MMTKLICLLTALLTAGTASARTAEETIPGLHKGTNIAAWLTGPDREIGPRDAALINNAGFDFVRLPIDPKLFHFSLGDDAPMAKTLDFYQVDRAIAMMASAGLAVVLDFHPPEEFKKAVEEDAKAQDRFVEFWKAAAEHYRGFSLHSLAYQLLNEPQYYHKEADWDALTRRLVAAIRSVDKDHLIIASAAQGSSIDGLLKVEPIDDPHVAYDFHFYEPYTVTHQGAWWFGDSQLRYLQHVPYPSSLVDKSKISVSEGGNLDAAMLEVDKYTAEDWNAAHIASRIQMAADWAGRHHVRLLNLEFGVLLTRTDPASRYRWITDVRKAFDADHIGWAVFDYTDSFAIISPNGETTSNARDGSTAWTYPKNGYRRIDPAAVKALGLASTGELVH